MIGTSRPMMGWTFILTLSVGTIFGFTFTYIMLYIFTFHVDENFPGRYEQFQSLTDQHQYSHIIDDANEINGEVGTHESDEEFHKDEDIVAHEMARQVRVLCWVMTSPTNHQKKAKHVKATWGKRCNMLLFMSSTNDTTLPSIGLPVSEGRKNLWAKTKEAFKYVYTHHLDQVDWVLKADDDTFVIIENLRYLLSDYNSTEPIYFGCRFKRFIKQGFMSGGAGYVLSKEAVRRFVEEGLHDPTKCRKDNGGFEDVEMGKCLEKVNVRAMDSRDSLGRGRFFPFMPDNVLLIPGHIDPNFWYWRYNYYHTQEGIDCCSNSVISFHYVLPEMMYVLEYLIYHVQRHGISPDSNKAKENLSIVPLPTALPNKSNVTQVKNNE